MFKCINNIPVFSKDNNSEKDIWFFPFTFNTLDRKQFCLYIQKNVQFFFQFTAQQSKAIQQKYASVEEFPKLNMVIFLYAHIKYIGDIIYNKNVFTEH